MTIDTENKNNDKLINNKNFTEDEDDENDNKDKYASGDFEDDKENTDQNDISMRVPKKTFFNRYFSKLGEGSLRASIFSLSIVSIGVGCLTLPKVFGDMSILICAIGIILTGFISYWTLDILVQAGRKQNLSVYSHVVEFYLGKKAAVFLDVVMVVLLFGVITVYWLICKFI